MTQLTHSLLFTLSFPLKEPVAVFLLMLLIILLAPMLSQRLRLPGVIGLIISGVVIGPHGFSLLERSDVIVLFGTVGLLYIMFLSGLELEWSDLVRHRHRSIVFGMFTFVLPLAIGFPVCYFGLKYPWQSSLLIASMFSTHTLIAYPIVSRLGILQNPVVPIAVGGTIITDSLVLLILTVITTAARGNLDGVFWVRFVVGLGIFLVITLVVLPMFGRWFFKKIEGEKTTHFLFVLTVLFLAAFLSHLVGFEPIVGAFMAGLGLNRLLPKTSLLMNRVEFVGNALFIPFFLVSVGMLVDLNVLFRGPQALIVAVTLTVVAEIGKWIAALATQKVFGFTSTQRTVLFGLSSAHAAATLAIILIGYELKILDENVLNGTILLILVTCLVASFLTEKAGKKIALENVPDLPHEYDKQDRFVIPIANPSTMEALVDFAQLVRDKGDNHPLIPLVVVKDDDEANKKVMESKKLLAAAASYAAANGAIVNPVTRVDLNVSTGIARVAKELFATDIVVGWRLKSSLEDRFFGTILDTVLANTRQQIFVCKVEHAWNIYRKVKIVATPGAELDAGFSMWVKKITNLARRLNAGLSLYAALETSEAFEREARLHRYQAKITHHQYTGWEEIESARQDEQAENLWILVGAREGTLAFTADTERIPDLVARHFQHGSVVILYPAQPKEFLTASPDYA
jgi:Kef-type K+ transport system membrane component KefB